MKIGIMGGTFDPVHNGHLMLAEYAYRRFSLDEVWFLPNGHPPHKASPSIRKDTADRVKMVELAIEDYPKFRLSTYETERTRTCYSWQTMEHFTSEFPEHDFFFIIGADSLFSMESWVNVKRFLALTTVLAAYRDDIDTPEEMNSQIEYLNRKYNGDIRLLKTPIVQISSHEIREKLCLGETDNLPVPEKVADYILQNHLYQGEEDDRNHS